MELGPYTTGDQSPHEDLLPAQQFIARIVETRFTVYPLGIASAGVSYRVAFWIYFKLSFIYVTLVPYLSAIRPYDVLEKEGFLWYTCKYKDR